MSRDDAFDHIQWCINVGWVRHGIRPIDIIESVGIPWRHDKPPTWQQAYLALKLVSGE